MFTFEVTVTHERFPTLGTTEIWNVTAEVIRRDADGRNRGGATVHHVSDNTNGPAREADAIRKLRRYAAQHPHLKEWADGLD